ncbi:hypothetical protein ACYT4E_00050 [Lactococcus lactis]|uniref:hypothetical protein n=1 Tax=Lactococcus lactis TaxID=1358 RepID=UPI0022E7196A|nr:hypothetical protein [Lactococcus lactis]MDA2886584.1 hypothetical protein [Lactococcus lactis]MDA2889195.1 hypothetical protein [Lactococcus lactis]MDA2907918.1 hypothetical protein [Lactococcus lactis]
MTQETAKERIYREALGEINNLAIDVAMDFEETGIGSVDCGKIMDIVNKAFFAEANQQPSSTDKLSVEKLQEELESCIQTLIEASVAATITQDIVVGNLVDRKLADLAKTHKLAVDYIEKVTGKKIDVVLAENAALEVEEDE